MVEFKAGLTPFLEICLLLLNPFTAMLDKIESVKQGLNAHGLKNNDVELLASLMDTDHGNSYLGSAGE